MEKFNPKQDFDVLNDNIYSSSILTNSNQKMLLLILLSNHKKFNTKHYSFTSSEELCLALNVSNPTFRKERDKLESLNLISVKIKLDGKMKLVDRVLRKHSNLYYYPNFAKLSDLGFIKLIKRFSEPLTLNDIITPENVKKLKDEVYYEFKYYNLNDEKKRVGIPSKEVKSGKEIKRNIKIMMNQNDVNSEYVYVCKTKE